MFSRSGQRRESIGSSWTKAVVGAHKEAKTQLRTKRKRQFARELAFSRNARFATDWVRYLDGGGADAHEGIFDPGSRTARELLDLQRAGHSYFALLGNDSKYVETLVVIVW